VLLSIATRQLSRPRCTSSSKQQQNERLAETELPPEDALRKRLERAEKLLGEIRAGKHSIQGVLVQIERYFAESPRQSEQP
jgi:hypothetical protein